MKRRHSLQSESIMLKSNMYKFILVFCTEYLMNRTTLIAGLSATLAISVIAFSLGGGGTAIAQAAEDFLGIDNAVVSTDSSELERVRVFAGSAIPTDGSGGAFGYGIITGAGLEAIAVTTTHGGVLDSVAQADASDASFHNHYVALHDLEDDAKCPGLEVRDITFQEPGDVDIRNTRAIVEDVPYYFAGTHSLSGANISFQADSSVGAVVSFTINPVDGDGNTSVTDIQAVCINDVAATDNLYVLPEFWTYR